MLDDSLNNDNANLNDNQINSNEDKEFIDNLNTNDVENIKEDNNYDAKLDNNQNIFKESFESDNLEENQDPVTIQPVEFASFDNISQIAGESNANLDLLMDIKLQLTVELGRCELPIKKVLELTRGSIIELDKIAGEPVELYANGKLVALGEVVVIEDNFGLRITSITDPNERIKNL